MKRALLLVSLGIGLAMTLTMLIIFYWAFTSPDKFTVVLDINYFHEAYVEIIAISVSVVLILITGFWYYKDWLKDKN